MTDDIGGVWRTIGGRRVFIKDGDDLETAMKKSGKFNTGTRQHKDDVLDSISNGFYTNLEDLEKDVKEQDVDVLELNEEILVIGYTDDDGNDIEAGYNLDITYRNEKPSTIRIGKRKYLKEVTD